MAVYELEDMKLENVLLASKMTALEHYRRDYEDPSEHLPEEEYRAVVEGHRSHQDSIHEIKQELEERGIGFDEYRIPSEDGLEADEYDLVISAGGDGTVLDTARYITDTPLLPVRSDENSHGAHCTYSTSNVGEALDQLLDDTYSLSEWTRLDADMGQTTETALNEVFIGARYSMKVARFEIEGSEVMSSGMVVSTGAGSTGWYSNIGESRESFSRGAQLLKYAVREPLRAEDQEVLDGEVTESGSLEVTSKMNVDGIISFDGDSDERCYDFPRGSKVEITVSENPLKVVK